MNHVPVRVSTLRGDQPIDFDAFVKINDKFILYLRKGDSFEGKRLARLKEKKLKKMFIHQDEEGLYRQYLQRNIEMAFDSKSTKPLETRAQIVQGVQQSNAEEVMENPANEVAYGQAKDSAAKFVDFLNKEDSAVGHILRLENPDASIAHHGVTVSTMAVALAKKLAVVDPKQTQLLSLGALLHDFDHFHSTLNIARPLAQFPAPELEDYKQHPVRGAQRVQDKKHFDQAVLNIIAQHEEFMDGSGFPQGLMEAKIDPLALIVGTANALDRLVTFEGVHRDSVGKQMMLTATGKYPLGHIQKLLEVWKSN